VAARSGRLQPGENAEVWPQCRDKNCIVIGWEGIGDFQQYQNEEAIKNALGVVDDSRSQNAKTIWRFTHEVTPGSIVVANKGRTTVVGLGIVTSDYIPPGDPSNPGLTMPNARQVDWKIAEEVNIPVSLAIPTVMPVTREQWEQIKQAYLRKNPALKDVFDHMEGRQTEVTAINPILQNLFRRTRNVILYGPPGTGKTFVARNFAQAWTHGQANEAGKNQQRNYWCVVASPKEWHWDVLFGKKNFEGFRRGRLKRNYPDTRPGDLVFGYLANPNKQLYCLAEVIPTPEVTTEERGFYIKGVKRLDNPSHGRPWRNDSVLQNSEPLRFRMQGTLFRFEPGEALYLRDLIETDNPEMADIWDKYWPAVGSAEYVRTVTFHQSYGYEDFVEGLRPVRDKAGQIQYEWRPGIFKQMCDEAIADPDSDFILIIDEINRATSPRFLVS